MKMIQVVEVVVVVAPLIATTIHDGNDSSSSDDIDAHYAATQFLVFVYYLYLVSSSLPFDTVFGLFCFRLPLVVNKPSIATTTFFFCLCFLSPLSSRDCYYSTSEQKLGNLLL